jgi:hypothetical protein
MFVFRDDRFLPTPLIFQRQSKHLFFSSLELIHIDTIHDLDSFPDTLAQDQQTSGRLQGLLEKNVFVLF